jgi:amino acid transporter
MQELPANNSQSDTPTLKRGSMSVGAATLFALTALQIGPCLAISAAYVQGVAGGGAWLSLLAASLLSLSIAIALTLYARRYVVSGSLVSYAYMAFGQPGRFLVGSCLLVGYLAALGSTSTTAVLFAIGTAVDLGFAIGGTLTSQFVMVVLITGLAAVLAYRGIDASVRVSVTLAFACIPVVLCILSTALLRHGINADGQFDLTHLPWQSLISGATLGFGFFAGFDGVTALAEETRNPLKSVPIVLLTSVTVFGVCIVGGCLLEAPLVRDHAIELDNGMSPLAIIASQGDWPALGALGDACITLASTAATIAFANYGARVLATAAIDGLLPQWMGAIHPHFRSPHRAVVVQGTLATLLPILLAAVFRTTPMQLTTAVSNMMVFMWLIPYIVVCAGTLIIARKEQSSAGGAVLAGVIGSISCAALLSNALNLPHSDPNWTLAVLSFGLVAASGITCCIVASRRSRSRPLCR